jgi:hypothetical protein
MGPDSNQQADRRQGCLQIHLNSEVPREGLERWVS